MSCAVIPVEIPGCVIDEVTITGKVLTIRVHAQLSSADCPVCHQTAWRIHGHYTRSPHDLPVGEQAVRLVVEVRRFFCDNPQCPRRTFGERFPALMAVRAQRTQRLAQVLQQLALSLGGEGGARIVTLLRMVASADTLLRLIRQAACPILPSPRVLGVDDFALRKRSTYGTLLVDLEKHQVVDLLADRTAETLAVWLKAHPEVAVISRDRSNEYARGATEGAPHALQVVDRWHLLQNLRQALERQVARLLPVLRDLPPPAVEGDRGAPRVLSSRQHLRRPSASEQAASAASRTERLAQYEAVHTLHAEGVPMLQIAKRLHLSRALVRKFVSVTTFPERPARRVSASILDPYESYLERRFAEGCHNGQALWRELRAQGFAGTHKQVTRWLALRRPYPSPYCPKQALPATSEPTLAHALTASSTLPPLPATRQLAWLLVREVNELDEPDRHVLERLRQMPEVVVAHDLAQQFSKMVKRRNAAPLDDWLTRCVQCHLPDLETFAVGLCQDRPAIRAALTEPWSNGQLEGQVNRLKLIKRQMYGRASFDLLRQRVLLAP